ncbi:MAG: hypothetical protein KF764_28670 [Labilithrix sp.]|nr:hypothetical protein [Labilithrix sp.]
MKTRSIITGLAVSLLALSWWGCSSVDHRLGVERGAEPVPFVPTPEDSGGAPDASMFLTEYCPSSECPAGWMTCPDSRFPCDTNILADSRNCGGCGLACPEGNKSDKFLCVEGACKLHCTEDLLGGKKDCDGIVDNGCESGTLDPNNCGACGVACAAGVPCIWQDRIGGAVGCGCTAPKMACSSACVDTNANDVHCGGCNNACNKAGPGKPPYPHGYYGCMASECGHFKCDARWADCDGDQENGCETSTVTNQNCGACGRACAAGQQCVLDSSGSAFCACEDDGFTFCQQGLQGSIPTGECVDVKSHIRHCGGCFVGCTANSARNERAACDYGKCSVVCVDGSADCNGAESDGCEVDTRSDPYNCGGCGIRCDLSIGQACVAGKCVVVPCDQLDAGEVTR